MEDPTNPKRRHPPAGHRREPEQRQFTQWAKLNHDGTVAAIVEVAHGFPAPTDYEQNVYVEVTDLWPHDLWEAKANPFDVQKRDVIALRASLKRHHEKTKAK